MRVDRAGPATLLPVDQVRLAAAGLLATLVVVAWDFLAATTFFGDDHLFLTFARVAPGPFGPFAADHHGGEYYRPLPMAAWWLLARLGGEWPFALWAFGLHATAAGLTGLLARRLLDGRAALVAAALFLVAPGLREAASWYAASTDLMATVAVLGSVLCALRGTRGAYIGSLVLAAAAYLSKESAVVLPVLVFFGDLLISGRPLPTSPARGRSEEEPEASPARSVGEVGSGRPAPGSSPDRPRAGEVGRGRPETKRSPLRSLTRALPHTMLALLYVAVRHAILHGPGGAGDDSAPLWARALQIASGLVHALVGEHEAPQAILWPLGTALLLWCAWAARQRQLRFALVWTLVALAPLFAAGWVVGERYFYLPAVGLAILLGHQLWARGPAVAVVAVGALLALGSARAFERRAEIAAYRARVAAAAQAVDSGLRDGHRLFHVRGAVKDLDLILKERLGREDFLVLGDVPASFVLMPLALASRTHFLLASPPLPPSGAYRFGTRVVVGLARRHESPDLEEVLARLPELRFIRLVPDKGGVGWRDVTESP